MTEQGSHSTSSRVLLAACAGVAVLHIWFNVSIALTTLTQNALHFGAFAVLCAVLHPLAVSPAQGARKSAWRTALAVGDLAFGAAVAASAFYLAIAEDAIYARGVRMTGADWTAATVLILGALELTRRTTGWLIPAMILVLMTYAGWWGDAVPGVFRFAGLSWETIVFRSIYADEGIFGGIARISSTFVFMFILFGAFLLRSGAGDFVIEIAQSVAGRFAGGPGYVAVIASGLMGTISGSAIANTASTGVITIPLMKRAGFTPRFAAGLEAAASTGGQIMPPIMGAGAFIMASSTQIPYTTIVIVSILPALLYYATVGFYVRIEARRLGMTPEPGTGEPLRAVFRRGGISFLAPVALLMGLLIAGFSPTFAALLAIPSVVAASWLTPRRMGPRAIVEALALGTRNMVTTAVLLCTVGLAVNVIAMAGIGNTFSLMVMAWAANSLFLAIVLVALASLILGMGLPVTAAYVILGTLSAPALYALIADQMLVQALISGTLGDEAKAILMLAGDSAGTIANAEDARAVLAGLGPDIKSLLRDAVLAPDTLAVALLSAHMIVFWLSQDSNVTPPVCLAAFTAAAIAGSPPMRTGLEAWKISKGLYVVPLLFAYTPFLSSSFAATLPIFAFASIGLYAFSAAAQGWMEFRLPWIERVVCCLCAAALIMPAALSLKLLAAMAVLILLALNAFGLTSAVLRARIPGRRPL